MTKKWTDKVALMDRAPPFWNLGKPLRVVQSLAPLEISSQFLSKPLIQKVVGEQKKELSNRRQSLMAPRSIKDTHCTHSGPQSKAFMVSLQEVLNTNIVLGHD